MKILIIVPAYNERRNIENVITDLTNKCPDYDYLIVDDGSSDGIARFCRKKGYRYISHEVNLGLDGAFQTGIRYAYEHGYDAAIQFDADGQHLPEYIRPMAEKIGEGFDIVIGSRFVNNKKDYSARMLGSRLISGCIHLTGGSKIMDPTSGMRMFSRRIMAVLCSGVNMGPEPDTICYLIRCGASVCEVPVEMQERVNGKSYLSLTRSIRYMTTIFLSILIVQWFRKKIVIPPKKSVELKNKEEALV